MLDIRLIASDMDGTMLNSQTMISPANAAALKAAQQKGVTVAVCSGRFPQFVSCKMNRLGISCPVIGANGGVLWDDTRKEITETYPMDVAAAVAVSDLLLAYGAYHYVFAPNEIVTSDADKPHPYKTWEDGVLEKEYGMRFDSGADTAAKCSASGKVFKYYVILKDVEKREELCEKVRAVPGIYVTSSGKNNIEIMREGINKRVGVENLAQKLGIPMQQVMTLGDYMNDVPMLEAAGLGVAMGNADEYVKSCADYVTDTNDNDGVAKAIEKFVL